MTKDPATKAAEAIKAEWKIGTYSRFCDDAPDFDEAETEEIAAIIRRCYREQDEFPNGYWAALPEPLEPLGNLIPLIKKADEKAAEQGLRLMELMSNQPPYDLEELRKMGRI